MALEDITLTLFAACNSIRMLGYIPQIRQAAIDKNGASAISCTTWSLFLVAHLSTVAYVLVHRADWGLAACFGGNAICCVAIIAVVCWKRRAHAKRLRPDFSVARQARAYGRGPRREAIIPISRRGSPDASAALASAGCIPVRKTGGIFRRMLYGSSSVSQ